MAGLTPMPPTKPVNSSRFPVSGSVQNTKIDATDRKIIYELEQNCRRSLNEIAKKARISKQTLHYRIERLVRDGIITQFVAILDVAKLGLINHEVWLQLESIPEEKKKLFLDYLISHPATRWVASCGGKIDVAVAIAAENTIHFNEILNGIFSKFPNHVKNYFVTITLDYYTYPRAHLLGEKENVTAAHLGAEPDKAKLDRTEIELLKILSKDARASLMEIAKKAKVTENTVRAKIKKLEKEKLIQTYSAIIQPHKIGLIHFEILASSCNITPEKEKMLIEYCKSNPYVTYYLRLMGNYNIDIAFDALNQEHFQKTIVEFRSRFSDIIKEFDFVYITYIHKFDYFAGFKD